MTIPTEATTRLKRLARYLNFLSVKPWPTGLLLFAVFVLCQSHAKSDSWDRIIKSGEFQFGTDMEGGAPYFIPNPLNSDLPSGFEAEFLRAIGDRIHAKPMLRQGQWDQLPQLLLRGDVDFICNGFELKPVLLQRFRATRPYFRYRLALMLPANSRISNFQQLLDESKAGQKLRVGVLVNSAADDFLVKNAGERITLVRFDGATDAMMATRNGQIDATLQDEPAATYYAARPEFQSKLKIASERMGAGWYVIYLRKEDEKLAQELDQAIAAMVNDGSLKTIYEKYKLWHEEQELLTKPSAWRADSMAEMPEELVSAGAKRRGFARLLLKAAAMTVFLSVVSMPLAMLIGLLVALGRLYGPRLIRPFLAIYVEFLRGTPLMLQLFFIYFITPELLGFGLPALLASIIGLALNYSAYESEIYRAGLQAIPEGQMEAALALGMTRRQALYRIIIPQATRIVIPPVTNDFIALFKDTSVCSVITIVELTKQYSILANSTLKVLEFGLATSFLYLAMSWPLSWFARYYERRLELENEN
jgi:polar amino acid transport system substrate-binding protein